MRSGQPSAPARRVTPDRHGRKGRRVGWLLAGVGAAVLGLLLLAWVAGRLQARRDEEDDDLA
ncbi:hypothetical protein GCM10023222_14350 [Saccharopolyspora cebuensis]